MPPSPRADLAMLLAALRRMLLHPWIILALALLGTALGTLGPLLQLATGQAQAEAGLLLGAVGLLPLEMYFTPRFLAFLDATTGDRPENPREGWAKTFDQRWLKAFGAKLLLALAGGMCLGFLVLPGPLPILALPCLLGLLLLCWTPMGVLLRGESLVTAVQSSFRIMKSQWPRVLLVGCSTFTAYFAVGLLVDLGLLALLPKPTLRQLVLHPAVHAAHFLLALLGVWLNLALLELFHGVEAARHSAAPGE